MQKHHEEIIRKLAEEIILKIDGGRLFGEPIDLQNTSHLIVASNMLAYSKKQYAQQSVHPTLLTPRPETVATKQNILAALEAIKQSQSG